MSRKLFAALAVTTVALTGCTVHVGIDYTISKNEFEQGISAALSQATGASLRDVECPGPVKAEVGASARCVVTLPDGGRAGVSAVITRIEGKRANYYVKVDDHLMN